MEQKSYHWYSTQPNGCQNAGFFVDPPNKILYWPSKKAPGYIINEETAEKIRSITVSDSGKKRAYSTLFLIIIIATKFIYRNSELHTQFKLITENLSLYPAGFLAIILLGILISFLSRLSQRRKIKVLLQYHPTVDKPRPIAQLLKPFESAGKKHQSSTAKKIIAYYVLAMLAVFGIKSGISSPLLGDKIFTVVMSVLIAWAVIRIRILEYKGLRSDQITAYKAEADAET